MRIFFVLLGCYLAAGASVAREPVPDKTARPGVFLITIDTLRADHVHCYGYDRIQTPALDLLAKQGIRFTQAFTPSPITNSSHASIFFQAEDGIRDLTVTGVQTCALPISQFRSAVADRRRSETGRRAGLAAHV